MVNALLERLTASTRMTAPGPIVAIGLGLAALAAYHRIFNSPFLFDDVPTIVENPAIHDLSAMSEVLTAQELGGRTSSGRPVVNLSLALNYALSGQNVWSYHAFNLVVHWLAALALFGVLRRTLVQSRFGVAPFAAADLFALSVAAIWMLHPLQTESVTYIVQRAESMAGLFLLITLYAFIRGTHSPVPRRWFIVCFLACLLGMATKETMVAAPLLVLLFDRTFTSGSFREAWKRRRGIHLMLLSTWLLLATLVVAAGDRGGTAGFGGDISVPSYLLTQCHAIVHYLRLALWPHPLVFDYGTSCVASLAEVWPQTVLLLALLVWTGIALVRRPAPGFAAVWFFALLAPSSSVIPVVSQTMAEHRVYLPLAAPIVALAFGLHRWVGSHSLWILGLLALGCGWATFDRNLDYRSAFAIWSDTVAKRPQNARAHNNLGLALFAMERFPEAASSYETATRLRPQDPEPHYNLGLALTKIGRIPEAVASYETALRLQPEYAEAHNNLGNALLAVGRLREAAAAYEEALRLRPEFAEAWNNLGNALLESGRPEEALRACERALELDPNYAEAQFNAGNALAQMGRFSAALLRYEEAISLRPSHAGTHHNLANVLLELDRSTEAIEHYQKALEIAPGFIDARRTLAMVLSALGRSQEALGHFEALVRIQPDNAQARAELERLRALLRP